MNPSYLFCTCNPGFHAFQAFLTGQFLQISSTFRNGRREILDQVRDYARAGGQILFGTDVGYLSDYSPDREYELMEAARDTADGPFGHLATLTTANAAR
jgi:hypothetical protein